ncbi:GapA-binding peptide SR1P [Paenibacillus radicis (ex Xue et al. 2023)]|uniref:GapA-binding peptide SR1P n=1 Tax=Paenibacillus radicis (ex Xue et al. 2023) TaxID=2972489 RepID=A0ABT1YHG1_9BACL|nr:GapA-binding peptide SR1P [Paenibacillus radicis (ex Xue et al. 2023)]MCR8632633.1 GapA-binding peptide SR1P [Paenibacillus radicis (ex Xue et al. 2023)]
MNLMNLIVSKQQLELGVIICKHCGEVIATQDTEKVTTYYSVCKRSSCTGVGAKTNQEELINE